MSTKKYLVSKTDKIKITLSNHNLLTSKDNIGFRLLAKHRFHTILTSP